MLQSIFFTSSIFSYVSMSTCSIPANLGQDNIFEPHIAPGPRYYHLHSKCASQHISGPTTSGPANMDKIYARSKHASQHICATTRSNPATRDKICMLQACQSTYMCARYEQSR